MVYAMLAREPKTQIAGIATVGDFSGLTRKHIPFNWSEAKFYGSLIRVRYALFHVSHNMDIPFQGGVPVFFPVTHVLNGPRILDWGMRLARPFLSDDYVNGFQFYR